jgi:hypothetical protein
LFQLEQKIATDFSTSFSILKEGRVESKNQRHGVAGFAGLVCKKSVISSTRLQSG